MGKVVKEYKAGKVEFRNDAGGNVHAVVGKLSFDAAKLAENIRAFINHVINLKPAAVRGQYIKGIAVSATMSPSVRIQVYMSVCPHVAACVRRGAPGKRCIVPRKSESVMSKYVKNLIADHLRERLQNVHDALLVNMVGLDANTNTRLRAELRARTSR